MTENGPEFLELFRDEATARLDHVVNTLLALESGRAAPDAVDSLFRDAHTIKGAAAMLGLEEIQEVAHAVEDLLDDVRGAAAFPLELIDPLLRAADSLRRQVEGTGVAEGDLLDELETSRAQVSLEPVEPEPVVEPPRPEAERRSIRVPAEKLDRLLDLVGETVLHRRRLEHALGEERLQESEPIADELDVGERLLGDLQETAIDMRTLPVASITGPFPRAVRDLAATRGIEVELVVTGAETELDRVILEGIADSIVHILRNAVAHGIETPDERDRLGKPRQGRLELHAEQRGGMVAITISDDGRGLPAEVLRQARVDGESLVDVVTAAGFSTAGIVTSLSGRGVGLNAVKTVVESFSGSISIESEPGEGTSTTLLLPLTLALLDVLLVERGGQVLGVPLAAVEEAIAVEDKLSLAGRLSVELRGESIPLFDLADLIGAAAASEPPRHAPALIVTASGRRIAALCDLLIEEQEVVVKSLGPLLASVGGYLGAAILGDGRIALLLDPTALVRGPGATRRPAARAHVPVAPAATKVLVVEDSFTVRELQRSILEAAGYDVVTARDGREALRQLEDDREIRLVVTDIEMPEFDGIELVRAIRAHERHSDLPVVIVTTRGEDDDRQAGLEAGADAYMAKRSFDQQALLDTIGQLVDS
jgi:two-component system chemotaxis sensor kinase CheA